MNKPLFETLAQRPHTIVQDALARNPATATIETVGDEGVAKDSMRTMMLYHVRGSDHSASMLMV
jgi:hypothetical protein